MDNSAKKRDFEATFFNLLSTFLRLSEAIDVGHIFSKKTGKDAFSEFLRQVYSKKKPADSNFEDAYLLTFFEYQDDLAHYIRNLFNLIHFVKDSRPLEAYFYVRMVRSTLSQPELVILALNGIFHDEGRRHFKPIIEEFALLNNITEQSKADFDLSEFYEKGAFISQHARPSQD